MITSDFGYGITLKNDNGTITAYNADEDYMAAIAKLVTVIPNMQVKCEELRNIDGDNYMMDAGFTVKDNDKFDSGSKVDSISLFFALFILFFICLKL